MTAPLRTSRRRLTTAVATAALVAVVGAPAVASAADGDDVQLAGHVGGEVCDDVLVRFTPGSTTGDERAAAIVAQALDTDRPGWEFVEWRADPATTVSAVVIERGPHAIWMEKRPGATGGFEEAVQALTICGSVDHDARDAAAENGEASTASIDIEAEGEMVVTDTPDQDNVTTDDEVVTVERPADTSTPVVEDDAAPSDDAAEAQEDEVAEEVVTEVLGVTLEQPAVTAATGGATAAATLPRTGSSDPGTLALTGGLALLAGLGVLVATRRRPAEAR
jgi:LPXTG-motif cell wall-anchored protein